MWKKKNRALRLLALLLLPAVLMGCTPRQKTIRLPESQEVEVEQENASGGFSVKRIYTYDYETGLMEEPSAFLSDCGPHEVKIITAQYRDTEGDVYGDFWTLSCQMVDYRYGFYDSEGELRLWHPDAMGDLIPRSIKISPTGREALFYEGSDFWGNTLVWLCDFETQSSRLLCETAGELSQGGIPSWSPSGRWMSYDIRGIKEGALIELYDLEKKPGEATGEQEGELTEKKGILGLENESLHGPDRYLENTERDELGTEILCQELFDCWEGAAGVLNFVFDSDSEILRVIARYPVLGEQGPDWELTENIEFYLYWKLGNVLPYLDYQINWEERALYYLVGYDQVERLWMDDFTSETALRLSDKEEMLLDFLRLEDGSFLTIQGSGYFMANEKPANEEAIGKQLNQDSHGIGLAKLQELMQTETLSLYWYPAGQQEGQLLYKDLHNLIRMEYDAQSRRILLETWQGDNLYDGKRQCMILEL